MTEAALAAISGGLGIMVLGLLGMMRWNGNGKQNGALEAKLDDALLVLREMRTILNERLPHR